MKIRTLTAALMCVGILSAEAAVHEVKCDFNHGIPADFTLTDADGNTLASGLSKYGFAQGDAWILYHIDEENNNVACSTSWYGPAGTSSDWMTLPLLEVAEGATLSWRAKASDAKHRDGYAVYISEKGPLPADFDTSAPIFSVAEEAADWQVRSVSLEAWKGKQVYIAFVNNSTDCNRLFIDDLLAGVSHGLRTEVSQGEFFNLGYQYTLSGYITNMTDAEILNPEIRLTLDGESVLKRMESLVIAPGERKAYSWDTGLLISDKGLYEYAISVVAGAYSGETSGHFRGVGHRIVVEDGTGTWCGWCVRGIASLERCKRLFPDNFIGLAIHYNDPMAPDNFTPDDVMSVPGYPAGTINRTGYFDLQPDDVAQEVERLLRHSPRTAIEMRVASQENKAELGVDVYFPESFYGKDYRIAAFVVEDDVYHPDDNRYNQTNAYSGSNDDMEGYEKMTSPIPAHLIHYHDVVRTAITSPVGDRGSIPESLGAGEGVSWKKSFTLPASVDNADNVRIVALVIDGSTGEVLNGETISYASGNTGTPGTPIADDIVINCQDGKINVDGADSLALYSLDGRLLSREEGGSLTTGAKGLALLLIGKNGLTIARKIQL